MPEESSSSQNVKKEISAITVQRNNRYLLEFSDGTTLSLESLVVTDEGLYVGSSLTESYISELVSRSTRISAERVAVKLASRNLHSQKALSLKLLKRGFSREVIDEVIQRLVETGYLDDPQFATLWLRSRVENHPEGRNALLAGLIKRGISRQEANQALD